MAIRSPEPLKYEIEIPELKKRIQFRALKVGEQKNLLTALEFKEPATIINAVIDIVKSVTFGKLDLSKTPMHIVDYVFLQSYIKSSGGKSVAEYTCGGSIEVEKEITAEDGTTSSTTETEPCGSVHSIQLDLERASIKYPENFEASKLINIDDKMSIKIRLPDFESFKRLDGDTDIIGISDQYIFSGIEYILDGDDMKIPGTDFDLTELVTWMNELSANILDEITTFFANVPNLVLNIDVTCPKCGRKDGFELEGLENFFL